MGTRCSVRGLAHSRCSLNVSCPSSAITDSLCLPQLKPYSGLSSNANSVGTLWLTHSSSPTGVRTLYDTSRALDMTVLGISPQRPLPVSRGAPSRLGPLPSAKRGREPSWEIKGRAECLLHVHLSPNTMATVPGQIPHRKQSGRGRARDCQEMARPTGRQRETCAPGC